MCLNKRYNNRNANLHIHITRAKCNGHLSRAISRNQTRTCADARLSGILTLTLARTVNLPSLRYVFIL